MRWEQLFADLDSRFAELADAEMMAELADRQRAAAGSVTLVQRCLGAVGASVMLRTRAGAHAAGTLREVGPDWLLLAGPGPQDTLVALSAVTVVEGLTASTGAPLSAVAGRVDLRLALRGIARDRAPVVLTVDGGHVQGRPGGAEVSGTIDRIGRDFIELAQHAVWEPRRATAVRSVVLVPLAAVQIVRSRPAG